MYEALAVFAIVVFLYSGVGGALERTVFGGAITFVAVGLAIGTSGLGLLELDIEAEQLRLLAEFTLALVLFTDAANADLKELSRSVSLPRNLLLIGLPLTILFGFLAGIPLFSDLTLVEVAILAAVLAPTDAALGKAVVTDETVPGRIRTGLNVESGLNDGICVPIFLTFLTVAVHETGDKSIVEVATGLILKEIGLGAGVGIVIAVAGAWLVRFFMERGWVSETWRQLPVATLAMASFAAAQSLGGSGFIASFAAGLVFGGLVKSHKHALLLAAEGTGDTLALLTWLVFGAAIVGQIADYFTWQVLLYAVLSLTLIRLLPVWLVLRRSTLRLDEILFIGWFGPRGLASVVFGVMLWNAQIPGGQTIVATVACTILLSILGHGLSAKPLTAILTNRLRLAGAAAEVDSMVPQSSAGKEPTGHDKTER